MENNESQNEQIIFDRFKLERLIGRGGMGDVYRALDLETGQLVAVKSLKPEILQDDPDILERFTREGQALGKLNHPNIVKILATVEENERHYLIMEYVAGGSLQDLLKKRGRLPVGQVLDIALDLADALTRAHRLKIIHRDIKPGNVLLAEDGTPRLTDFGVASMGDRSQLTETGALVGTFAYLSPEACKGEPPDERTDIWAFGVMLYEMLTGENPFRSGQAAATIQKILNEAPEPLTSVREDIPPSVAQVVDRMMDKNRETRTPSVRQVGADLETIIRGFDTPLRAAMNDVVEKVEAGDDSRFDTPTSQVNAAANPENSSTGKRKLINVLDGSVVDSPLPKPPAPPPLSPPSLPTPPMNIREAMDAVKSLGGFHIEEHKDGSKMVKVGPLEVVETSDGSEYVNLGGFMEVFKNTEEDENRVKINVLSAPQFLVLLGVLGGLLLCVVLCVLAATTIF